MKSVSLILFGSILMLVFVSGEAVAQRGGGGRVGGGASPSLNRSPSMSRPAGSRPSAPSGPSIGQRPATSRPATPTRPSAGQLPATRPGTGASTRPSTPSTGTRPSVGTGQRPPTGQRPSSGQVSDFLNLPKPGSGTRPSTGGPPMASQLPSTSRDKIQNSISAGSGQRPSMPDWFKPGASPPTASQLPARPGTGDGIAKPPGAGQSPSGKPPIAGQLPATKPPTGGDPPVATPPIAGKPPGSKPPGTKPPIAGQPPVATPPIAGKPGVPPVRPPGIRPPARPPVVVRPPLGHPPRPWYPGHPNHPSYRPGYWWRWATAGAITGWVVHRWTTPIYYTYETGGTVYYENNVVYVNGKEYGSAEQYYNEGAKLAASVPKLTDEQAAELEWLPLGVFAVTKEGINASSMYLQLAVTKNGMIAGTFYNESTGVTHPVEGFVDEQTQRAAWKAADGTNANLVMETGIYNLTKDQAPVLMHFGPEETQNVLLVRLNESERPEAGEPVQQ